MRYDIRFPAATQGWTVAAALDVCYQIPVSMVDINRDVDITDVLVLITDNSPNTAHEDEFSVRLHSVNHAFGYRVARHSQLAVALNLSRHLSVPAILPGPGTNSTRWWLAQPDGQHQLVTLNSSALAEGRHRVDVLPMTSSVPHRRYRHHSRCRPVGSTTSDVPLIRTSITCAVHGHHNRRLDPRCEFRCSTPVQSFRNRSLRRTSNGLWCHDNRRRFPSAAEFPAAA